MEIIPIAIVCALVIACGAPAAEGSSAGRMPLALSDGTKLPPPFATDAQLEARKAELRKHYEPFTRDLTPARPYERPVTDLTPSEWLFKQDPDDWGELKRWFAADGSEEGWEERALPDYREYPRGWYRTRFDAPTWSADRTILRFEGVDYSARVYLNDRYIGEHTGYFMPFEFDVTDVLKPKGNVLAVRVDNPVSWDGQQDSFHGDGMATVAFNKDRGVLQWSNGAGIYRPVKLIGRSLVHVGEVKVTPRWPDVAEVQVEIANTDDKTADLRVTVSVVPRNFQGEGAHIEQALRVSRRNVEAFPARLPTPKYWTPDSPYLYTARITVSDASGKVLDSVDTPFGMRWFEQDADGGFLLNKEPSYVRGSCSFGSFWLPCIHDDRETIVGDILTYKAANLDLNRLSLYIAPESYYDYADMYGLMTYQDMPLNAFVGSVGRSDMTPIYSEEVNRQARDMVDYLYNHPSIVIWQVANESQTNTPVASQITPGLKETVRILRQIDPTRLQVASSGFTSPMGGGDRDLWGISDDHWYFGAILKTAAYMDYLPEDPARTIGFTPKSRKIITEYGAPAYPDWETWRDSWPWEMPTSPDDLYDVSRLPKEFVYRGIPFLGDATLRGLIMPYTGEFVRPSDWVRYSQEYHGYYTRLFTDILRRRPDINGYAHFYMIESGPNTFAQSVVDNMRRPKEGYFALAQASAPRRINIQYEGSRFFSGDELPGMRLWVYNDPNRALESSIRVVLADQTGRVLVEQNLGHRAIPGASRSYLGPIQVRTPVVKSGRQRLFLYAILSGPGGMIDYDCLPLDIFAREKAPAPSRMALFDAVGKTARALRSAGIDFREWKPGDRLGDVSLLVIGAYSSNKDLTPVKDEIRAFAEKGGHLLVLNQTFPGTGSEAFAPELDHWTRVGAQADAGRQSQQPNYTPAASCDLSWLPAPVSLLDSGHLPCCTLTLPVGRTPLMAGLTRDDLFAWDGGANYVAEYPIDAFDSDETIFACKVWDRYSGAIVKPVGAGKLLFSQLILVDRYGIDPVATRLLNRMLDPVNWAKLPDVSVSKEAAIDSAGTGMAVKLTISNPIDQVVEGDVLDQVLQDVKSDPRALPFRERVRIKPGQRKELHFERALSGRVIGDLPSAVFVFDDGRWVASNPVAIGTDWARMAAARAFDFGPKDSPVAEGYTQVNPDSLYTDEAGFGWIDSQAYRVAGDRHTKDPLTTDYIVHERSGAFRVRLPKGRYLFRVVAGDVDPQYDYVSPTVFSCAGKEVGRLVRSVRHCPATLTFRHEVQTDGTVDITFACPYKSNFCPISALTIYEDTSGLK